MTLRRLPLIFPIVLCALAARAEPPEYFINEARGCRDRAHELLNGFDNMQAGYAYCGDFTRDDVRLAKVVYDAAAAQWTRAAEAFDKQDAAAGKAAKAAAEKLLKDCDRWHQRLDARVHEADVSPKEGQVVDEFSRTPAGARPAFVAVFDARQRAAEAWCVYAEGVTPEADPDDIADLNEAAVRAGEDLELATDAYNAAMRRETLFKDKQTITPEARQVIDQIKQLDEQRLAARRAQLDEARKVREIDRQQAELEAQLHDDYGAKVLPRKRKKK